MDDLYLLRQSLSRVNAAAEWAKQAGLLNVFAELSLAAKDIRDYLHGIKITSKSVINKVGE